MESRLLALIPHCTASIAASRCMPECRQALNQFGLLGTSPMKAASRPLEACSCRDSIIGDPFSSFLAATSIDPAQILKTCGLAGASPTSEALLESSMCTKPDQELWATGGGYEDFLPQQKYCGGACFSILGALAADPTQFSACVATCIRTQRSLPYTAPCSTCFGNLGVCVSSMCGPVCGGATVSEECAECAFANCNAPFTACSSFDASVPPSPPSSIDGMCGDSLSWMPCGPGEYRTTSNECRSVLLHIENGAGSKALVSIAEYYLEDDTDKPNAALQRTVHRMDFDTTLYLASSENSLIFSRDIIYAAFNESSIVPFIDGPFLISHAAVKSAIESDQGRTGGQAFVWQTDMHSSNWGPYGPTELDTGSDAHSNARAMILAAWPALSSLDPINLGTIPDAVVDGVKASGGDFTKIDDDVKLDFVTWIVKSVLKELFPGSDTEDQVLDAALATLGTFNRKIVSPLKYHSISGLFASDSMGLARGALGNWIEEYYGEERMQELCDIRGDNLSSKECGVILADSCWVNTFTPLVGLIMDSLSKISGEIGVHVKLFRADTDAWLQEAARIETPVEAISYRSGNPLTATWRGEERTYSAGEGLAVAWLASANKDANVFEKPYEFNMLREDKGEAIVFNALRKDKDSNAGLSLSRLCPAHRFSLRIATAVIEKMLPGDQDLNALSAGLPLKDNELYEAYVVGGLTLAAKDPTATASAKAAGAYLQSEIQRIIQEVDKEEQNCLFFTNAGLLGLRAGLFSTNPNFQTGAKNMMEPEIVMNVPGLGIYYGIEDALEYANIMADSDFNGDYHTFLQQYMKLDVMKWEGGEGDELDYDKIHMLGDFVSAWENYTRFSTPIYDNNFHFSPCSARVSRWDLVFGELDDGSNPTFDYFVGGAYENTKLCGIVMDECVGEHQQFDSLGECVKFYDSLPEYDDDCLNRENGVGYALQGNTTLCRFLHHFMMHESPEKHCYHVGRGDRPDVRGHFKCVPEDCIAKEEEKKEAECTESAQVSKAESEQAR